jgi:hypothetical protein
MELEARRTREIDRAVRSDPSATKTMSPQDDKVQ